MVRWHSRLLWLILGVAVSWALVGCVGGASSSTSSLTAEPASVADIAQKARADGPAEDSQIEILDKGAVSFPDYEAAVNRALDCMTQAGIDVIPPKLVNWEGVQMLDYSWSPDVTGLSKDQGNALGNNCLHRFSFWVEMAYQLQPSSVEAREKNFDAYRAVVVTCIRQNGGTVADDATRDEANWATGLVRRATGIDCFEQAGIT